MPKLQMPNGDVITLPEGMSVEEAAMQWRDSIYAEHGYDPNHKIDLKSDPTKDMSSGEKFLAGVGSGMVDVGRNAVNLLLPEAATPDWASDEAIARQREVDQPLTDTGWGATGKFVGETAALLPAGGLIGAGVKGAAAKALPGALKAARVAAPAAEGLAAGAIVAGPEARSEGATMGALGGAAGHAIGRALGRTTARGLLKRSPEAESLAKEITETTGEKVFMPVQAGAEEAGGLSTIGRFIYEEFLPFFPLSRRALQKQADDVAKAGRRTILRKALPHQKSYDAAEEALKGGARIDDALEAGIEAKVPQISKQTDRARQVLQKSMAKADKGEFTFDQLAKTSRGLYGDMGSSAPHRVFAESMKSVLENPTKQNNIMARNAFYKIASMTAGLAAEVSAIPRILASKGFQNFLMGNMGAQRAMAKALQSEGGAAAAEELGRIVRLYLTSATVGDSDAS